MLCRPLQAPFDPEGLVSSLNAIITTLIGAHFGHVLILRTSHDDRLRQWVWFSVAMLVIGVGMHFGGVPKMNTDLYSVSCVAARKYTTLRSDADHTALSAVHHPLPAD